MFIDQLSNGTSFIDEQHGRVTEFVVMPPGKMAVCCHVASEQPHDGPHQSMTTNDLVARLRAMADGQHDDLSIGDEAADEIARLTKQRDAAQAEIERLTAELDKALDDIDTWRSVFPDLVPEQLLPLQHHWEPAEVERLRAEVERLTTERDEAAKAERARCMAIIRRLHNLLPTGERKRSKPGLRDALLAIELLDQSIEAQETEDTP